ncbi:MAG: DUF2029 domain-containing protein [Chloroflexi bacterium]|nr:MAG: DUF2029 domain-containing protein [Chloroflexota bacterium]
MPAAARRNLTIAAAAAATAVAAVYDLWLWLTNYAADNFHNDFTFYYAAARLGLQHGWARLYDLGLQQQQLDAIESHITVAQLARYVSPPPLAWLVIPLTPLPYQIAYWAWSAVLAGALVLAWRLTAPDQGRASLIFLVAAVGWLPVIYGLQLGQPALLVAAAVACCSWLLRHDRPLAAGAVLGFLVLKPQLALLVPPALLVMGRWRAFAGAAVATGLLVVASLIALGPQGTETYLARLAFASGVPENRSQTLAAWIPNLELTRAVQAVIAAWTLALVYRLRRGDARMPLSVALVGGLAASPYAHYDDLTMLGLAALLYLGAPHPRWTWTYLLGVVIAAEGFPIWGAGPVLAGELGALALLSVAALKHDDGDAEQHHAEGQHHTDLERDRQHVAIDGES